MKKCLFLVGCVIALVAVAMSNQAAQGDVIKWHQPPDMRLGINIQSTQPDPRVADDWRCTDEQPVTDVHFWGSYIGWEEDNPNPPLTPPPAIQWFIIRIYEDVPAGPDNSYSHPGELIKEWQVPFEKVMQKYVGPIQRPDNTVEHKFYCSLDLPDPFDQDLGRVYWLSVAADMSDLKFPWGWEISSEHWNDNAVTGDGHMWKDLGHLIGPALDFEDLPLTTPTTQYTVGDTFVTSSVPVSVNPFQWSSGVWTDKGYARPDTQNRAGGSGIDLNLNNVNLDFGFGIPLRGLSLLFGEYGGNLNIEINGDFRNVENFPDIHGAIIGGVEVKVIGGALPELGKLVLTGPITQFAIGGQELWIDSLTPHLVVDMAFDLTAPYEPPPVPESVKWQQRPDMKQGVNIASVPVPSDEFPPGNFFSVADDWLCLDGSPVSDLHFWGSYLRWFDTIPVPPEPPPGVDKFRIQVYSDAPAVSPEVFSRPDKLLYEVWVDTFTENYVDAIPIIPGETFEHKFRYDLDLPRMFWQRRDRIYWLNIAAVPKNPEFPWGWESSMDRWNDEAVQGWYKDPDNRYWEPLLESGTPEKSDLNMSFELTTCKGPIKWLQFPDMAQGANIPSIPPDQIVADDWRCREGKPITEVHFWGSYVDPDEQKHWEENNPGPPRNLLPSTPGVGVFKLSIHEDVPPGADPDMPWSHPDPEGLLLDIEVDFSEVLERYWDSIPHTNPDGEVWWEHKFYYIIRLKEPFPQEEGKVYWLNIAAKPLESSWVWGWETSKDHWNDDAVRGDGVGWVNLGSWGSDFDDLPLGATYHDGDTFVTSGIPVAVKPFPTGSNVARVVNFGKAGGSGNELEINNVTLDFDFRVTPARAGLSLVFGEYGGTLHMEVNGDTRDFDNFVDIKGHNIGGPKVSVVNGLGNDMGRLTLTGPVVQFAIGGQELYIDDLKANPVDMSFLLIAKDDTPYCLSDFNREGDVDGSDLAVFAGDFDRADCYFTGDCEGDFDYDGKVDPADLGKFAEAFGRRDCPCSMSLDPMVPSLDEYGNSGCLPDSEIPLDYNGEVYPGCGEDGLEVVVEGETARVVHKNATYNCCPDDIAVSLSVQGNLLKLAEQEILTTPCYCLCCYDVTSSIVDLTPGLYMLEYCWKDYETNRLQCLEQAVEVP